MPTGLMQVDAERGQLVKVLAVTGSIQMQQRRLVRNRSSPETDMESCHSRQSRRPPPLFNLPFKHPNQHHFFH